MTGRSPYILRLCLGSCLRGYRWNMYQDWLNTMGYLCTTTVQNHATTWRVSLRSSLVSHQMSGMRERPTRARVGVYWWGLWISIQGKQLFCANTVHRYSSNAKRRWTIEGYGPGNVLGLLFQRTVQTSDSAGWMEMRLVERLMDVYASDSMCPAIYRPKHFSAMDVW